MTHFVTNVQLTDEEIVNVIKREVGARFDRLISDLSAFVEREKKLQKDIAVLEERYGMKANSACQAVTHGYEMMPD